MALNIDNETLNSALTEARAALSILTKAGVTELLSLRQPPPGIVRIFEGVTVFLDAPKPMSDWPAIKKWCGANVNQFLQMLMNLDMDRVSDEQLQEVKAILTRPDCQPDRIRKCSTAAHGIYSWLNAVVQCKTLRRQLQQFSEGHRN